jgi:hypothetical protein
MPPDENNVALLADEYKTLVMEAGARGAWERPEDPDAGLREALIRSGDWTPSAAEALTYLARKYGVFMLRNALALASALGTEDGSLGF